MSLFFICEDPLYTKYITTVHKLGTILLDSNTSKAQRAAGGFDFMGEFCILPIIESATSELK